MMEINVRPHTDTLRPVSSITRDGIQNKFMEVQVRMTWQTRHRLAISFSTREPFYLMHTYCSL